MPQICVRSEGREATGSCANHYITFLSLSATNTVLLLPSLFVPFRLSVADHNSGLADRRLFHKISYSELYLIYRPFVNPTETAHSILNQKCINFPKIRSHVKILRVRRGIQRGSTNIGLHDTKFSCYGNLGSGIFVPL